MSEQNQAKMPPLVRGTGRPVARGASSPPLTGLGRQRKTGLRINSSTRTSILLVIIGLLIGLFLGLLTSCSDDRPRSRDSELLVDEPDARAETGAPASAAEPATAPGVPKQSEPLPGAGRRYRVLVGTAYFFDVPEQSTPNGKYLRRGDIFYGEGETNGFVKTGFVGPNGARSTGWLKVQELSTLPEAPGSRAAVQTRSSSPASRPAPAPVRVTPPPAAPASNVEDEVVAPRPVSGNATTAVVQADRSYFYSSPDLTIPRKAHCIRGDKVRLGETRGDAVYVTFTNWQKVTSTGWMKKDALAITP